MSHKPVLLEATALGRPGPCRQGLGSAAGIINHQRYYCKYVTPPGTCNHDRDTGVLQQARAETEQPKFRLPYWGI